MRLTGGKISGIPAILLYYVYITLTIQLKQHERVHGTVVYFQNKNTEDISKLTTYNHSF